ncbi:hypothetical protein AGLY_006232 [Aphis glycines]|uniref:Uncharacterized protein n=1 Tax=Aphis glycines TaxID=307491 RepID=A0A6G0TRC8_APHGL|nr:hypothetical protein AGLY_006232 [Aphis glycines]
MEHSKVVLSNFTNFLFLSSYVPVIFSLLPSNTTESYILALNKVSKYLTVGMVFVDFETAIYSAITSQLQQVTYIAAHPFSQPIIKYCSKTVRVSSFFFRSMFSKFKKLEHFQKEEWMFYKIFKFKFHVLNSGLILMSSRTQIGKGDNFEFLTLCDVGEGPVWYGSIDCSLYSLRLNPALAIVL